MGKEGIKNTIHKKDNKFNNKSSENRSLFSLYVKHMALLSELDFFHFWGYIILGVASYLFYPFAISFSAKFINSVVEYYKNPFITTKFLIWLVPKPIYYAFLWFGIWIVWRIVVFLRDLFEALLWLSVYHGGVYKKIFTKYYSLNLEEIQENEIFDALSRFGQYWMSISRSIHKNTVMLLGAVVSLTLTFGVMLSEHSSYGLIKFAVLSALLPLVSSIALYIQDKVYRKFVKKETNKFRLRDYLIATLLDSKTFLEKKVNGIYNFLFDEYSSLEQKILYDKNTNWKQHEIVVGIFNTFEYYLFVLLRVFFVMISILSRVKVGTITGNLTFLNNIYTKVKSLLNNLTSIIGSLRYTRDLFQILDLQSFADTSDNIKNLKTKGIEIKQIKLRNLSFKFPDTDYVFENVDFTANLGDNIMIYGKDGSGKSSFVKILTASFALPRNSYFINDVPVERVPRGFVKNNIALIPEYFDRYFFSLKVNIVNLGEARHSYNKSLYLRSLKLVDLLDWAKKNHLLFSKRPLGKYFGEGIALPSGFWQRLAIARAIYLNRPVLLCDMCFSLIDQHAKKFILQNLLSYSKETKKIFIMITEDLDFAQKFDKVFWKKEKKLELLEKTQLAALIKRIER